ncbi:hypothetical protein GCM10011391_31970 [Pullulanibacillus camelliae]|uniref:YprB ribonuclease H-like domain-containing protein n=1 Tax=Pullulanibacillus camelliae TaxID=1707096 RepID=A0A8J3E0C2_9BACL|nr:ribonuclease H-like domain-containing protein [Pullulanibacillus camelliae]GGE50811.1 hypothetical protein GCM10011391_31970 [Pullulanibacillus camelliae]
MSLKKQLDRYKKHLKRSEEPVKETRTQLTSLQLERSLQEAASHLGASILPYEQEAILVKEEQVPLTEQYGRYHLNEIHQAVALWQETLMDHPLSASKRQPGDLLFFDTETTGLSAGAGHMIFLLGCGWIKASSFHIKQYFLPGPGHETAFYYHFLQDVTDLTNLVTYNGKSFDWPRVKTRVQFVRERVPQLPAFGHYDLLHASRRFWRKEWENVRLQTIEEEVLDLKRLSDVPGHMAPFLYFEFLKSPKAALIEGIFRHNHDDIKTLLVLYIHLTYLLHGKIKRSLRETYEVARWLMQMGMIKEAIVTLENVMATKAAIDMPEWYQLLAMGHKKAGRPDRAIAYYQQLIDGLKRPTLESCIELAKLFEHERQDYEQALHYCHQALAVLEKKMIINHEKYHKDIAGVHHRMDRLQQKIQRQ